MPQTPFTGQELDILRDQMYRDAPGYELNVQSLTGGESLPFSVDPLRITGLRFQTAQASDHRIRGAMTDTSSRQRPV